MSKNDKAELSLEELEAVNGGGFLDDVLDFGKGLWKKTRNVILFLRNWG